VESHPSIHSLLLSFFAVRVFSGFRKGERKLHALKPECFSFLPRICYSSRDERGLESQIQSHHLSQSIIIIIIIIIFLKKDDFVNRNAFSEKKERKDFWAKILQKISREQGGTVVHWTCARAKRLPGPDGPLHYI